MWVTNQSDRLLSRDRDDGHSEMEDVEQLENALVRHIRFVEVMDYCHKYSVVVLDLMSHNFKIPIHLW